MVDEREGPTPERLAKAGEDHERIVIEMEDGGRKVSSTVQRMLDTSIIEKLYSYGAISLDQHSAGVELYQDWYRAGFANSGVIDPSKDFVDGGRADAMGDVVLDAAGRFAKALMAVGKLHSNALIDLVLLEKPLAEYGRKHYGYKNEKQAKLAATIRLKDALTSLDHHYHGQRKTRTRHAGADDYRPMLLMPDRDS